MWRAGANLIQFISFSAAFELSGFIQTMIYQLGKVVVQLATVFGQP